MLLYLPFLITYSNTILKYPILFENSIDRYSVKNALISALVTIWDVKINKNQINRLKNVVFFI